MKEFLTKMKIKSLRSYGTLIAALLIMAGFGILSPEAFATPDNFINISRQISFLVIVALGTTLVMTVGEFDLSVGAVAGLTGVLSAKLAVSGVPLAAAFTIPVFVAFLIGFVNGMIVSTFRVLSFIITLAMGTAIGGFTFWLTGGATVFENIPEGFRFFGQTNLGPFPFLSVIMVTLTLLFWYIMRHTVFGRKLYALGGNEHAARIAGIRVNFYKNMAFALCSALAGIAGVLMASRLGSAHPTGGDGLFLPSYAAAFLGMTASKEGVPNIWGSFIGAAILGILANGLTILQVPSFMQDVVTGLIVILAVLLQKVGSRNR